MPGGGLLPVRLRAGEVTGTSAWGATTPLAAVRAVPSGGLRWERGCAAKSIWEAVRFSLNL